MNKQLLWGGGINLKPKQFFPLLIKILVQENIREKVAEGYQKKSNNRFWNILPNN
jgi:hypothetical protein